MEACCSSQDRRLDLLGHVRFTGSTPVEEEVFFVIFFSFLQSFDRLQKT